MWDSVPSETVRGTFRDYKFMDYMFGDYTSRLLQFRDSTLKDSMSGKGSLWDGAVYHGSTFGKGSLWDGVP